MVLKRLGPTSCIIEEQHRVILYSYETPVVLVRSTPMGEHDRWSEVFVLDPSPSRTTSKHINRFLASTPAHTVSRVSKEVFNSLLLQTKGQ